MITRSVPSRRRSKFVTGLWLVVTIALGAAPLVRAQASQSAAAVKELVSAMDAAKLDSIAAADPSEPGTFVAALYFPGTQLLVVSAKYAAPSLLVDKLANKSYRDIYIDLNSASMPGTKVFVMDSLADGLVARPGDNEPFDNVDQGDKQIAFDGDWDKADMEEEEYMKAFAEADAKYAHMVSLLTAQLKSGSS